MDVRKVVIACLGLCVLMVLFTTFIAKPVTVSGGSMENTYMSGELLIVDRTAYMKTSPQRGDIVVCRVSPSKLYIKRVIAVGGEEITIENGQTYINGEPLKEEYLKEEMVGEINPQTVPEGEVFVMGDNRNNSTDSRSIGTIKIKDILGKARKLTDSGKQRVQ